MAIRFTTSSLESTANGVKIVCYGPAGMGKTMLNATLPKPVLISAEAGTLSLRKTNIEKVFGVNNPLICYDVPLIVIQNIDDLNDAYRWCTESAEAKGFDSISLDSITEIAEQVLSHAKKEAKDLRQAYGALVDNMLTTIKSFRDLPEKHVYLSAKQGKFTDETTNITKYGVSMPGQRLGGETPYLTDEVFALRIGKDDDGNEFRYLQTQPDIQFDAKDRSGSLLGVEYPHLGAIITKIMSS